MSDVTTPITGRPARSTPPASRPPASRPPAHAPRVPFALLVGALVVGGLCALLALNTASAANELNRHDVAAKDASIAAQLQQLRNDVAAAAAPGNLGAAAAALGMVPAGNPAFLSIGPDGRVRVMGSAAPATEPPLPVPVVPTPLVPRPTAKATKATPAGSTPTRKAVGPAGARGTAATTAKTAKSTPTKSAAPPPTPTPTPTTTLPGGDR